MQIMVVDHENQARNGPILPAGVAKRGVREHLRSPHYGSRMAVAGETLAVSERGCCVWLRIGYG